ncbi:MAG: homoserine dehydrogenase [Chthonomonadales bacterium]|nr:homoserine dehydrogenase [Chthonomonadales bacterium]
MSEQSGSGTGHGTPPIQIGLLGLGVVGSGAYKVLTDNADAIEQKVGAPVVVKKIAVRNLNKERLVSVDRSLLTDNPDEVLDDPDIAIVCELIGGVHPAKEFVLKALRNGKSVVSANKELIAKDGHDAMVEAAQRNLDFMFEGSVGGGIPIIQAMKSALAGNAIHEVKGIVNGTTNYILTRMTREGAELADVLRDAQAKGYAEADPTNDVEGFDAQYKIAILSSIAFTSRVQPSDVYTEGIMRIGAHDIEHAREMGYVVKLLAIGQRVGDDAVQVRVHPALVPASHPLASTSGPYNAILVRGDAVGDVMFYGQGAGMLATGSAVVGDIIEVCRNLRHHATGRIACTCFEHRRALPMDTVVTRYYVRMYVTDRPGTLAAIAGVFGRHQVSIESVRATAADRAEAIWVTHRVQEANMRRALKELGSLPEVYSVENWLRVEE